MSADMNCSIIKYENDSSVPLDFEEVFQAIFDYEAQDDPWKSMTWLWLWTVSKSRETVVDNL